MVSVVVELLEHDRDVLGTFLDLDVHLDSVAKLWLTANSDSAHLATDLAELCDLKIADLVAGMLDQESLEVAHVEMLLFPGADLVPGSLLWSRSRSSNPALTLWPLES